MNFILVGSGSGGHIYPCLSFYKTLKNNNHEVSVLTFKEIDRQIYLKNKVNTIDIKSNNFFDRYKEIYSLFNNNKFDCLVIFGSKPGLIASLVAKKLNIPIYICEQNIVLGKANKLASLFARKVFLSLPIKENKKYIYTGNPVTENISTKKVKIFNNNSPIVLIVCGSLGSSSVSKIISNIVNSIKNMNFIFIKGKYNDFKFTETSNIKVYDYYEPLTDLINSCDLIISRAGASTISEIIELQKPSILIPSPYVTNNHQYKNAKFLKDNNGCILIEEKKLDCELLKKNIFKLIYSDFEQKRIKKALRSLKKENPASTILKLIESDLNE